MHAKSALPQSLVYAVQTSVFMHMHKNEAEQNEAHAVLAAECTRSRGLVVLLMVDL
jgi:hypothetical protein